jgi:hypothetical protein
LRGATDSTQPWPGFLIVIGIFIVLHRQIEPLRFVQHPLLAIRGNGAGTQWLIWKADKAKIVSAAIAA